MARVASMEDTGWGKLERVSPGLYRTLPNVVDGGGHEWDDLVWFREMGLDIADFKLAGVAYESDARRVRRFRATYVSLDDPRLSLTPPWRGSHRAGDDNGCDDDDEDDSVVLSSLALAASEDVIHVRVDVGGPSWEAPEGSVVRIRLVTDSQQWTDNRLSTAVWSWRQCMCQCWSGCVVGGFWGAAGSDSLSRLGLYLRNAWPAARWSPPLHHRCPEGFRRAVRELLLAHKRMGCGRTTRAPRWNLGALPPEVLQKVVEQLKEVEAGLTSRSKCPFFLMNF